MAAEPAAARPPASAAAAAASGESPAEVRSFLADDAAIGRWSAAAGLTDAATARRVFCGWADGRLSPDLLANLIETLGKLLPDAVDADRVLVTLDRFLGTLHSPLSAVALFQRDPAALETAIEELSQASFTMTEKLYAALGGGE